MAATLCRDCDCKYRNQFFKSKRNSVLLLASNNFSVMVLLAHILVRKVSLICKNPNYLPGRFRANEWNFRWGILSPSVVDPSKKNCDVQFVQLFLKAIGFLIGVDLLVRQSEMMKMETTFRMFKGRCTLLLVEGFDLVSSLSRMNATC